VEVNDEPDLNGGSLRREGRNHKGRGGSARSRQLKTNRCCAKALKKAEKKVRAVAVVTKTAKTGGREFFP